VNVAGGIIDPFVRPGIDLVEKLGQVFSGLAGSALTSLDIEVRGELADYDVSVYRLAALKGILSNVVSENVSYVNAPLFAEQRGIEARLIVEKESPEYRNLTTLRGALADGTVLTVAGTLAGTRMVQKIVGVNGYDIEVPLEQHHIVMLYTDRPGIVAVYGQKFGEAGINIAGMQIARREAGGQALSILTVDSRVPEELLAEVGADIDASVIRQIEITED
jgi:D-3-phosphoglycerate dehydrogenase